MLIMRNTGRILHSLVENREFLNYVKELVPVEYIVRFSSLEYFSTGVPRNYLVR